MKNLFKGYKKLMSRILVMTMVITTVLTPFSMNDVKTFAAQVSQSSVETTLSKEEVEETSLVSSEESVEEVEENISEQEVESSKDEETLAEEEKDEESTDEEVLEETSSTEEIVEPASAEDEEEVPADLVEEEEEEKVENKADEEKEAVETTEVLDEEKKEEESLDKEIIEDATPSDIEEVLEEEDVLEDTQEIEIATSSNIKELKDIEVYKAENVLNQLLYNKKDSAYLLDDYVVLEEDVSLDRPLYVHINTKLNLNNHTLTGPKDDSAIIVTGISDKEGFTLSSFDVEKNYLSFGAVVGFSKNHPAIYVEGSTINLYGAQIKGAQGEEAISLKNSNIVIEGASIYGGEGKDKLLGQGLDGAAAVVVDWDTNDYTFTLKYGNVYGGNGGNGTKSTKLSNPGVMLRKGDSILYYDSKRNIGKYKNEFGGSGGDAILVKNQNTNLANFIFDDASCVRGGDTGEKYELLNLKAVKYEDLRLLVIGDGITKYSVADDANYTREIVNPDTGESKEVNAMGKAEDQGSLPWCELFMKKANEQMLMMIDYFDYIKHDKDIARNIFNYDGLRFSILQREFDKVVIAYDELGNVSKESVDASYRRFDPFVEVQVGPTRASEKYGWGYTIEENMKMSDMIESYSNDRGFSGDQLKYLSVAYFPQFDRNDESKLKTQRNVDRIVEKVYEEKQYTEGDGFDINYSMINTVRRWLYTYKKPVSMGTAQYPNGDNTNIIDNVPYRYKGRITQASCQCAHGVMIVGFDDTVPKENFKVDGDINNPSNQYTPRIDGAYIIKNSWGDEIEYVSYDTAFYVAKIWMNTGALEPKGYNYSKVYKKATGYHEAGDDFVELSSTTVELRVAKRIVEVYKKDDREGVNTEKLYALSYNSLNWSDGECTVYKVDNPKGINNNTDFDELIAEGKASKIGNSFQFKSPDSTEKDVFFDEDIFIDANTDYFAVVVDFDQPVVVECQNHGDTNSTLVVYSNDEIGGMQLEGTAIEDKIYNNTRANEYLIKYTGKLNSADRIDDNKIITKLHYTDERYGEVVIDKDYVFRKLVDANRNLTVAEEKVGAYLDSNGGFFAGDEKVKVISYIDGEDNFLQLQRPEKSNSEFLCWNTNSAGTGKDIYTYEDVNGEYNILYAKYKENVGCYRVCFTDSENTFSVKAEYEIQEDGTVKKFDGENYVDTTFTNESTLMELFNDCQPNVISIDAGKEVKRFSNCEGTVFNTTNKVKDLFETSVLYPMIADIGASEEFTLTVNVNGKTSEGSPETLTYTFSSDPSQAKKFSDLTQYLVSHGAKKKGYEIAYYRYKDDKLGFVASNALDIYSTIGSRNLTIECEWKLKDSIIKFNTGCDYYIKDIHYSNAFVGDFKTALSGVQRQGYIIDHLEKSDGTNVPLSTRLGSFYDEGVTTLNVVWSNPEYKLVYLVDANKDTNDLFPSDWEKGTKDSYNTYTVKYDVTNYHDKKFHDISSDKEDPSGNYLFAGYNNDHNKFNANDRFDEYVDKYGFMDFNVEVIWKLKESVCEVVDSDNTGNAIPDFKFELENEPVGKILRVIDKNIQESDLSEDVKKSYFTKKATKLVIDGVEYSDISAVINANKRGATFNVKFEDIKKASIDFVYEKKYLDSNNYTQYKTLSVSKNIAYDASGAITNTGEIVTALNDFYNTNIKNDITATSGDMKVIYDSDVSDSTLMSISHANDFNAETLLNDILQETPIVYDAQINSDVAAYKSYEKRKIYRVAFELASVGEEHVVEDVKINIAVREGLTDEHFVNKINGKRYRMYPQEEVVALKDETKSSGYVEQKQYILDRMEIIPHRFGASLYDIVNCDEYCGGDGAYYNIYEYLHDSNIRFSYIQNQGICTKLYYYKYLNEKNAKCDKLYRKVEVATKNIEDLHSVKLSDFVNYDNPTLRTDWLAIEGGLYLEFSLQRENLTVGRDRIKDYAKLSFEPYDAELLNGQPANSRWTDDTYFEYETIDDEIIDVNDGAGRIFDSMAREIEIKTRREHPERRDYYIQLFADARNRMSDFERQDGMYRDAIARPYWQPREYSVMLNPEFSEYDYARHESLSFNLHTDPSVTLEGLNPKKAGYELDYYKDTLTGAVYHATSSITEFLGSGDNFADRGNSIIVPIWKKSNKNSILIDINKTINGLDCANNTLVYEYDDLTPAGITMRQVLQNNFSDYYESCESVECLPYGFKVGYDKTIYGLDMDLLRIVGYTNQEVTLVYDTDVEVYKINIFSAANLKIHPNAPAYASLKSVPKPANLHMTYGEDFYGELILRLSKNDMKVINGRTIGEVLEMCVAPVSYNDPINTYVHVSMAEEKKLSPSYPTESGYVEFRSVNPIYGKVSIADCKLFNRYLGDDEELLQEYLERKKNQTTYTTNSEYFDYHDKNNYLQVSIYVKDKTVQPSHGEEQATQLLTIGNVDAADGVRTIMMPGSPHSSEVNVELDSLVSSIGALYYIPVKNLFEHTANSGNFKLKVSDAGANQEISVSMTANDKKLKYIDIYAGDAVNDMQKIVTIGSPDGSIDAEQYFAAMSIGDICKMVNQKTCIRLEPHFEEGVTKLFGAQKELVKNSEPLEFIDLYKKVDENNENPDFIGSYVWAKFPYANKYWAGAGNPPETGTYVVELNADGNIAAIRGGNMYGSGNVDPFKNFVHDVTHKQLDKVYFGKSGNFVVPSEHFVRTGADYCYGDRVVYTVSLQNDDFDIDPEDNGPFNVNFYIPEASGSNIVKTAENVAKGTKLSECIGNWPEQYFALHEKYEIVGYYTEYSDGNFSGTKTTNYEIMKDVDLYVDVKIKNKNVKFFSRGRNLGQYSIEYGTKISETNIESIIVGLLEENENVEAYFTNEACTEPFDLDTPITTNMTLYFTTDDKCFVKFCVKNYTQDNVYTSDPIAVPCNTLIGSIEIPEGVITYREGYDFHGWYDYQNQGHMYSSTDKVTKNLTLYGYFTKQAPSSTNNNNSSGSSSSSGGGSTSSARAQQQAAPQAQTATQKAEQKANQAMSLLSNEQQQVVTQAVQQNLQVAMANVDLPQEAKEVVQNTAKAVVADMVSDMTKELAKTMGANAKLDEGTTKQISQAAANTAVNVAKASEGMNVDQGVMQSATKAITQLGLELQGILGSNTEITSLLKIDREDDFVMSFANSIPKHTLLALTTNTVMSQQQNMAIMTNLNNQAVIKGVLTRATVLTGPADNATLANRAGLTKEYYNLQTSLNETVVKDYLGNFVIGFNKFNIDNVDKYYYMNDNGTIATGWIKDASGNIYFFKPNGEAAVSKILYDNIEYQFDNTGKLISTNVDESKLIGMRDLGKTLKNFAKDMAKTYITVMKP